MKSSVIARIYRLTRHLRRRFVVSAVVAACIALCDTGFGLLTRRAVDAYAVPATLHGLWGFILLYGALLAVKMVLRFRYSGYCWQTESILSNHLQKTVFRHLQALPVSYFDKHPVGQIISVLLSDTSLLGDQVGVMLMDAPTCAAYMLFSVAAMLALNPPLALLMLLCLPLLLLICYLFQKSVLNRSKAVRELNGKVTEMTNETIGGAFAIKTAAAENWSADRSRDIVNRLRRTSISVDLRAGAIRPLALSAGAVMMGAVIWRGGGDVLSGTMSAGTLVLFIQYIANLFDPVASLGEMLVRIQSSRASAERVLAVLDEPAEHAAAGAGSAPNAGMEPMSVQLEHVRFHYGGGPEVLSDVSLSVPPGRTAALVGETGAGKTTIAGLVCRFYMAQEGAVYIDGTDIRRLSWADLYGHIGYVPQQSTLFTGTIRENILYARPDASDEEMIRSSVTAGARGFIQSFPDGYDTQIGEGGRRLSAGQRQLISLARALMTDPRILILDEATSSVDSQTEQIMQQGIAAAMSGRTGIVIAHRLSITKAADVIFVLEGGKLTEQGSYAELMSKEGAYARLYRLQAMQELERSLLKGETGAASPL